MIGIGETFGIPTSEGLIQSLSTEMGPVFSSKIVLEPGLIDKLELLEKSGVSDDDPLLLSLLPIEDFVGFTNQTGMRWSEETDDIVFGNIPFERAVLRGLYRRIWDRIRGISLLGETEVTRYLPIADLHRPQISGCKATLSLSSEHSLDHSFSIKIFGFGGGSGEAISFGRITNITTPEKCVKYYVPVTIKVQVFAANGHTFVRGDIIDIQDGHEVLPIPEGEDLCGKTKTSVEAMKWETRDFLHFKATGSFTETVDVGAQKETKWEWGIKFNAPILGDTETKLNGVVKTLKTIGYTYDLVGKHNYTGYNAPGSLSFCWDWEPK